MEENKNYNWDSLIEKFKGLTENEKNSEEQKKLSAEDEAEISIQDLRNKYAEKVRENFDLAAKKLRAERDNALRENWILQQQEEAALPERIAAGGFNGGASETGLAAIKAKFQGNRNNIQNGYLDDLGELQQQQSAKQAEHEDKYNRQWIEYLLSLAKENAER